MMNILRRFRESDNLLIALVCAANVLFHLLLREYGYHGDELYYCSIADGFSFSNLDMPPVAPLYLKLFLTLFGHSLAIVHLASSVAGSVVIALTCLIARELGGGRYAVVMTGIFTLFSSLVIFGSLYTYDCVSFILWIGTFYLIVRMLNGASQRLWLWAGMLMGLGFLTKMTILFLGTALFITLWLVRERRWYRQPWIWLGALLAFLCSLPIVLWQWEHGWYLLQYLSGYSGRTTHESPVFDFIWSQILPNNLFAFPVWMAGLGAFLFARSWKRYRLFGVFYVIVSALMFALGGHFYFMVPVYALLIAAGSIVLERWIEGHMTTGRLQAWRLGVLAGYVLLSIPFLPMLVPVLSVEQLIPYIRSVGVIARNIKTEDNVLDNLPQHFAQRFGWDHMAQSMAGVYHDTEGRSGAPVQIVAGSYTLASAVHVYKKQYNLAEPLCPQGWFYFEGTRKNVFLDECVTIGCSRQSLMSIYRTVEGKGVFNDTLSMPGERNDSIYVCSGPKVDLSRYWRIIWRMDQEFDEVLRTRGIQAAVTCFRDRRRLDSSSVLFTEQQMNRLGYDYLAKHMVKEAILLFQLNTEAYPDAFNTYDSLGEALMAAGDYSAAEFNYSQSIRLNPMNDNGRKKLDELKRVANARKGNAF